MTFIERDSLNTGISIPIRLFIINLSLISIILIIIVKNSHSLVILK
jgi:hypothetical protein